MSANHENDLSPGRRYKKYEHAYNHAFGADPNPENRKFQELDMSDIQRHRLEVFRGNDKDAYDAYKDNPSNPMVRPETRELDMWKANDNDKWRIDREPAFGQHAMTNNKWFDCTLEQRRGENTQKYFDSVEQRYGAGYEGWAAKAGTDLVAKDDYLQTMATLEIEQRQATHQQKLKTAQIQPAQAPETDQAPVQTEPKPVHVRENEAQQGIEVPKRTRLSLANFANPEDYISQVSKELSVLPEIEWKQRMEQADADHQAMGRGRIADAGPKVEALNAYHAQEVQQQIYRQQREVPSQTETQRRTLQQ